MNLDLTPADCNNLLDALALADIELQRSRLVANDERTTRRTRERDLVMTRLAHRLNNCRQGIAEMDRSADADL